MAARVFPWLGDLIERILEQFAVKTAGTSSDWPRSSPSPLQERLPVKVEEGFEPLTSIHADTKIKCVEDGSNFRAIFSLDPKKNRDVQLLKFTDVFAPAKALISDSHIWIEATFASAAVTKFEMRRGKKLTDGTKGGILRLHEFEVVISRVSPGVDISVLVKDFSLRSTFESPTFGKPKPVHEYSHIKRRFTQMKQKSTTKQPESRKNQASQKIVSMIPEREGLPSQETFSTQPRLHAAAEENISMLGGVNLAPPIRLSRSDKIDLTNESAVLSHNQQRSKDLLGLLQGKIPASKTIKKKDPAYNTPIIAVEASREHQEEPRKETPSDVVTKDNYMPGLRVASKGFHLHERKFRFTKQMIQKCRVPNLPAETKRQLLQEYGDSTLTNCHSSPPEQNQAELVLSASKDAAINNATARHESNTSFRNIDSDEGESEDDSNIPWSQSSPIQPPPAQIGHEQHLIPPDSSAPESRNSPREPSPSPPSTYHKGCATEPRGAVLQQGATSSPSTLKKSREVTQRSQSSGIYGENEARDVRMGNENWQVGSSSELVSRLKSSQSKPEQRPGSRRHEQKPKEDCDESSDMEVTSPGVLHTHVSSNNSPSQSRSERRTALALMDPLMDFSKVDKSAYGTAKDEIFAAEECYAEDDGLAGGRSKRMRDMVSPPRPGKRRRPRMTPSADDQPESPPFTSEQAGMSDMQDSRSAELISGSIASAQTVTPPHREASADDSVNLSQTVFQVFRQAYPDYTAELKHFVGRCRAIYKLLNTRRGFPFECWDAFVILHWTEYRSYAQQCGEEGEEVMPYEQFFEEEFGDSHHNKRILSLRALRQVVGDPRLSDARRSTSSAISSHLGESRMAMCRYETRNVDGNEHRLQNAGMHHNKEDIGQGRMSSLHGSSTGTSPLRLVQDEKTVPQPSIDSVSQRSLSLNTGPANEAPRPSSVEPNEQVPQEMKEVEPASSSAKRTQDTEVHAIASSNSFNLTQGTDPKNSSSSSAQGNEWWKDENTPFKEFARSFTTLKVFGGRLEAAGMSPFTSSSSDQRGTVQEVTRKQRIDVLGWRF